MKSISYSIDSDKQPKSKWRLISILIWLALLMAGCDPHTPIGVRKIGAIPAEIDPETPIVLLIPIWGPGGPYMYISSDGGLVWKGFEKVGIYEYKDIQYTDVNCTFSCEFSDLLNDQIRYRILPGKSLHRSLDGGETWQEILQIPKWNLMERNYIKSTIGSFGPDLPADVRGPFDAVTDPKTGKLFVAMGIEGILIQSKDGQWSKPYAPYSRIIQPTRFEMLTLIHIQEWLRGPVIALVIMLFGLSRIVFHRFRKFRVFLLVIAGCLILVPFDFLMLILDLSGIQYEFSEPLFYGLLVTLVCTLMIIVLINDVRQLLSRCQNLISWLARLSGATVLGYWLMFLSWSQGFVLSDYIYASMLGLLTVCLAIVLILVHAKKYQFIYHITEKGSTPSQSQKAI